MFNGKTEKVEIQFKSSLANVVLDRYGKDVAIYHKAEDNFTISVDVAISKTFFSWIFMLGSDVNIISPKSVIKEYKKLLVEKTELYC